VSAPLLFALTMFVSATLLFLVQPMIGKMVTPLLGGTPAVWNTCMVFYQALLLGGYFYAHRATTLPPKKQTTLHLFVMFAALGFLLLAAVFSINSSPMPIVKSLSPQGDDYPFFGVIVLLSVAIGLPFFVVSTSAPLLQKWFAETGHPSAKDPYFLYAASNFGSLLALIAYPAVVEPNLRIIHQNWVWAVGYGLLVLLAITCARAVRVGAPPLRPATAGTSLPMAGRSRKRPGRAGNSPNASDAYDQGGPGHSSKRPEKTSGGGSTLALMQPEVATSTAMDQKPQPAKSPTAQPVAMSTDHEPRLLDKARWLALAFVPSSLMLGVTTFISTDMASIPLLWIIPLSLYLLTFIIVFSNVSKDVHLLMALLMPVMVLLLVFMMTSKVGAKFGMQVVLHMATFFIVAMVCHGELARTRPSPKHLTDFYLIMSLGGMLGGLFNALVAPIVFTFTSEYPITLVMACCLLPTLLLELPKPNSPWSISLDMVLPAAVFFGCTLLQRNSDSVSNYVYSHGGMLIMGVAGFLAVAIPAIFLLATDLRSRAALGILFGSALALYVSVGPAVVFLAGPEALSYAEASRWAAVILAAGAYCLYWSRIAQGENRQRSQFVGVASLIAAFALLLAGIEATVSEPVQNMIKHASINFDTVQKILVFGVPAMICYFFVERPIRFGAAVAALLLATFWVAHREETGSNIDERYRTYYDRSFFGRLKVLTFWNWKKVPADQFPDDILKDKVNYEIIPEVNTETLQRITWKQRSTGQEVYYMEVRREEGQESQHFYMKRSWSQLIHGNIVHGLQERDVERRDVAKALLALSIPDPLAASLTVCGASGEAMQFPGREPLTYYHRDGPVGSMFDAFIARNRTKEQPNTDVACIGLGTGSLSSYGVPGQRMTFFEIDTHVRRLVEVPKYFTYIDSALRQGVNVEFVMGDARVTLERLDRKFGFMLIDAFSSDAIPAHLLTKESVELYFQRLEEDGLLAIHISNRYIDLEPVVERICRELKLEARLMHGNAQRKPPEERYRDRNSYFAERNDTEFWENGKYAATWIAVAKTKEALGRIDEDTVKFLAQKKQNADISESERWIPLKANDKLGMWTDDFSPIIPILRDEWRFWSRGQ